ALAYAGDLRPAPPPEMNAAPTGAALLASLVEGLKNWEQGTLALAEPHFRFFMRADTKGADAWAAPYQTLVAGYLEDFATLTQAEPKELPTTAKDCKALVDEYHVLHDRLKTKGRAPFNVRVWQLELEKRARELATR
ncbi:MAG: serine/threonine protein kinase, partial [Akkermansiaceae bacterium]|nr:serine/threonine protein kinase [Akkermansiaceae bacterium]